MDTSSESPSSEAISSGDGFHALDSILLEAESKSGISGAPEIVKLFVGVDANLTVTAFAKARISDASERKSIVGVPLAVRFK